MTKMTAAHLEAAKLGATALKNEAAILAGYQLATLSEVLSDHAARLSEVVAMIAAQIEKGNDDALCE
jgi:hypothetical protein